VIVLGVVAVVIRIKTAFAGGIWADEGFFLLIARSSSFREMVDFLHFHESHPPLFYTIVRLWTFFFGTTETVVRLLCAALSAAIIPAVYLAGRTFFSHRSALLATVLAVFSPALTEHSTQIRPYGLMTLLVLASCSAMLLAVERQRRADWAIYIVATLLLLYTHNWAWHVIIGQHCALIALGFGRRPAEFRRLATAWLYSWLLIAGGFLPWSPALLYQMRNAGHAAVSITGVVNAIELLAFGIFSSLQTLFLGRIVHPTVVELTGAAAAIACASVSAWILRDRRPLATTDTLDGEASARVAPRARFTALLVIVSGAVISAILLSPLSNQLLARCISTLIPLVALVVGYWVDLQWTRARAPHPKPVLAAAAMAFVLTAGVVNLQGIIDEPRSNAREVASVIRSNILPSDLLVVVPEWFAASFNRYFPQSIEQVDFPYASRGGLTDFSEVWERISDSQRLARMQSRLANASAAGRRVWLVSEVRYLRGVTADGVRQAEIRKDPAPYAILRTSQIMATLEGLYGQPDSARIAYRPALYDNLRAYLYSHHPSDKLGRR